jgi:nitrate/nitrite transport system permease protein
MKDEAVLQTEWAEKKMSRFNVSALGSVALEFIKSSAWTLAGCAILMLIWAAISAFTSNALPSPFATLKTLWQLISHPFYDNGPNDKGIGLQIYSSIIRVFIGFALGSLVAIPTGILIGASDTCKKLFYPLVQLLRPVSPLAWFPIGLVIFKNAGNATIFMIFITSLWPTVINTAFGVASIPEDHRNVARAFAFSKWRYFTRILLPFSMPHILTGLRLSMGVAWLVIVAGEMMSGGIGIGFFVWDSYNGGSLEKVMSAIILIGVVGLILDRGFDFIAKRFTYA